MRDLGDAAVYTSDMFLDEATISVIGGKGGDGRVSWRREKFIPKGGPSGGDGGRGGSVILVADDNTDTLSDFASRKRFAAEDGQGGMVKDCHGRDGTDLLLKVPPGTIVHHADTKEVLADLRAHGDRVTVALGGRGGFGNAHFKSSTRRKPDFAERGDPGEKHLIKLDLKLVADVGIIGYPNVGKSTLISVVSSARPKIANYPFTTLIPNLGVASVGGRSFVLCDIPGLIEGASDGKGLGDQFLRHIERCGILVHILDLSRALTHDGNLDAEALIRDYRAIRHELAAYSALLAEKQELVVLNKTDLTTLPLAPLLRTLKQAHIPITLTISAATKLHTDELMKKLLPIVLRKRKSHAPAPSDASEKTPVLRPHEDLRRMGDFRIEKREDGALIVHGKRLEQFTRMTDFSGEGGQKRFLDVLKRIGLLGKLRKAGEEHREIFIGTVRIDSHL